MLKQLIFFNSTYLYLFITIVTIGTASIINLWVSEKTEQVHFKKSQNYFSIFGY